MQVVVWDIFHQQYDPLMLRFRPDQRSEMASDHGKWFPCKSESTRSVYCHECNKAQDHDQLIMQNHHHASVTQMEDFRKPFAISALLSGAKTNSSCFNQGTCFIWQRFEEAQSHAPRLENRKDRIGLQTSWPRSCSLTMQWWWSANHLLLTATAPVRASTRHQSLKRRWIFGLWKVPQQSINAEVTHASHLY